MVLIGYPPGTVENHSGATDKRSLDRTYYRRKISHTHVRTEDGKILFRQKRSLSGTRFYPKLFTASRASGFPPQFGLSTTGLTHGRHGSRKTYIKTDPIYKCAKLYRQRHGDHSQSHSLNLFRKGYCAMRSESNNRQKNRGPPQDLLFIVPIHSDI